MAHGREQRALNPRASGCSSRRKLPSNGERTGNWGLRKLEEYEKHESIDEKKHADKLIERILFLDGLPNLHDLGKLMIGEDAPEALRCDLKLEQAARPALQEGIAHCESVRDYISRENSRGHSRERGRAHRLARDAARLDRARRQNWLQSQAGSPS